MTDTQTNWLGRRVLVTGATGMVGSALSARLVAEGASVVALVQDVDPLTELFRSGTVARLSVVNGRLEDAAAVERAIAGNDVDSHFPPRRADDRLDGASIAQSNARIKRPGNLERPRRGPAAPGSRAYRRGRVERQGLRRKPDLPYTETMPLAGTLPYEVSKSMTDLVSRSYALTYGVPAVVARCGNIYGPGDLNWSRIVPGTFRSILRTNSPCCAATARSCATTCTSTTSSRRISR